MVFKKFDIYSSKLAFTINKQTELRSSFGGILSIITIIFYIIFFLFFAKDLYLKINPKITTDKFYLTKSQLNNYTITEETFFFAIESPLNFKDPKLYNFKSYYVHYLNGTKNAIELDFISCKNSSYSKIFLNDKLADSLICLNITKASNKNLTNISVEVSNKYIVFEIGYDHNYLATLDESYKKHILNTELGLNFYWPELSFSPNNYETALDIQLNFYRLYLNNNTMFISYNKFVETKLIQDENIIFEDMNQIKSVIYKSNQFEHFMPRTDQTEFLASFFFTLDGFYYYKYLRIYKKLPQILAEVFGVMQPLMIAFTFFIEFFSNYNLDYYFIKYFLCYFSKEKNKDDKLIWKYQSFQDFKNVFKYKISNNKENSEQDNILKTIKINVNDPNTLNSQNCSNNMKKAEDLSEIRLLKENTNKYELEAIEQSSQNIAVKKEIKEMEFFKEKTIELVNVNDENLNNYIKENKNKKINVIDNKISEGLNNSWINQNFNNEENKGKIMDISESLKFFTNQKNEFPNTSFFYYFFPFFFTKKNKYENYTKIFKHFSRKILKKLDLFNYLKYIRRIDLLKNTVITNDQEKEKLKILSKNLYFIRDCDIESLVKMIDQKG